MRRLIVIVGFAAALLAGTALAQEKKMCRVLIPCDVVETETKTKTKVVTKEMVKVTKTEETKIEWDGSPPPNPVGVGMHHLACQAKGDSICCYAEMTEHEWKHCKTKSWRFSSKGDTFFTERKFTRIALICRPKGSANVGYKTSTGRHLIAHFE